MQEPQYDEATEPEPVYGDTWVYESIVGALPGIDLTEWQAVLLQIAIFEISVLFLAWAYDLWNAALAGTAAVFVAAVGSIAMVRIGEGTRSLDLPTSYQRLLFGSRIEVVLTVLAFIALITHLFVFDPERAANPLVTTLFGEQPDVIPVYLMLLVLWDLCYRIGASWWASVVALWRSYRFTFDGETAAELRRVDLMNVAFGLAQLVLVPFILDRPVLLFAVGGHVVAVTVVSVVAMLTLDVETGGENW
ncbi:hypothetical protein AUR64_01305 [Haloprofundus marisrubri]|uniref:Uncharacterized protein n=1 Tax=Haloprofundus marisrubri TaxID=1514971 RepID=A0A0W1R473_9EURY|nr:hypothetical protein [Haloprofundus marisrubri]KTG07901.1 hypothetical protein AUR64_01305 [Haloprofundus marisrubri]